MNTIEIPGTTFVRDTHSKAIINRDVNGLQDYLRKRNLLAVQKEEINKIKTENEYIKQELSDIKQMMFKLLEKGSNG
jgi:RIO-like serine/threonine protein kinase